MGLLSNTKWVALSQGFKVAVQLLNIVVLARLIPPGEYGLMAMALVVTNFAILVRDLGTAAAIIQRQDLEEKTINAIFWLNVAMGLVIAVTVIASSPVISYLFHESRLIFILCLLSISFPLASTSSAHLALLEKRSRFREIAFIEISSSATAVTIAIVLAYMNWGVYSLVMQSIIMALMSTIQLWLKSDWRPTTKKIFDWHEIKNLLGFSGNLTLFNFINYFSRNADSMIIGHYLSSAVLGAYSLAYRIMLFPVQNMTFVASRALFPIFSEHQKDNEKLRESYYSTLQFILLIVLPLMTGLAVLSEPFVNLVFGEKWHLTASILTWLAPTGIIQAVLSTSGTVFMAKGRTDVLMKLGIVGMILQVSAFVLGVNFGILNFAKFYFIANLINFVPVMWSVMRMIDGKLFEFFKRIYNLIIATLLMVAFMKLILLNVPYFYVVNSFVKLVVISLLGGGGYLFYVFVTEREISISLKSLFKNIP
ncbi:Teichuronic acid biosynthesis protein TuaB [Dickeya dianthicola]|uniref:Colanic acid exporter n=2 Tax=Dickeya dianthicola TaxID=204039 RepID=A0AAP6RXL6_9GAMM|nr:MOP flippase family protein [Dickeya dianthicola]AYC18276.1 Teichuronic acid biosynthesis protein TuaB [Dickeya dianthicola]MBI0437170.1 MOP flippase family protein [Dickeya dianthicola]MBI0447743.1 MOP flippase family protein [Dickeya dianthicola]MBI0452360.1 MOP flippase family protein [Dickeya dianthicola]MBI0456458.1 MOP flippase family protein [Dickeya dianthicola]